MLTKEASAQTSAYSLMPKALSQAERSRSQDAKTKGGW